MFNFTGSRTQHKTVFIWDDNSRLLYVVHLPSGFSLEEHICIAE